MAWDLPINAAEPTDRKQRLCEDPNYVKFGEVGHRASMQLLGYGEARGMGPSHSSPVCRDTTRQRWIAFRQIDSRL